MTPVEIYLALVAFFGSTLSLIIYFRESGTKLEIRANKVVEEKKGIVSERYKEVVDATIERFKSSKTLTEKLEDDFENVSFVRVRLNGFHDDLSEVVDKITYSIGFGLASVTFTLAYVYLLGLELDALTSLWLQIITLAAMSISFYLYISGGINKIYTLRKYERLTNEIERNHTFGKLLELLIESS